MIHIAILGASGYTGVELVRLAASHPHIKISALSANAQAGKSLSDIFPSIISLDLPTLQKIDEIDFTQIDVVFCCLPHAATQATVKTLPDHIKVVDLSADFRLRHIDTYEKWYTKHQAIDLQKKFVYGLCEHYADDIAGAQYIANPGCYPTASLLPLLPLLNKNLIDPNHIIIDAKSGVSGAGRALREGSLAAEVQEGFTAYSIGTHRHQPEIAQELSVAAKSAVTPTFTPHLLPMNRGILATIYTKCSNIDGAKQTLTDFYKNQPFVTVLQNDACPSTRHVRGSNACHINVFKGFGTNEMIIVSVIDNLIKGASGQAIQNMNIMHGFDQALGLPICGLLP